MALRKPLVLNAGQLQQLQAGDTLDAPQASGDQVVLTNDESGAIVIGAPVYVDANDGVKKAQANASATTQVMGLVAATTIAAAASGPVTMSGVLTATTAQWDVVAGTSGGLTRNTKYWLSAATAGNITATAPSAAGQYVVYVGLALSTTELLINIRDDILL